MGEGGAIAPTAHAVPSFTKEDSSELANRNRVSRGHAALQGFLKEAGAWDCSGLGWGCASV